MTCQMGWSNWLRCQADTAAPRPRTMCRPIRLPPGDRRAKIHNTNPFELVNGEVKCRAEAVGIFPNEAVITRLVGAILLEQDDRGSVQRARYMTLPSWGTRCQPKWPQAIDRRTGGAPRTQGSRQQSRLSRRLTPPLYQIPHTATNFIPQRSPRRASTEIRCRPSTCDGGSRRSASGAPSRSADAPSAKVSPQYKNLLSLAKEGACSVVQIVW
jgi:hypothetical protein